MSSEEEEEETEEEEESGCDVADIIRSSEALLFETPRESLVVVKDDDDYDQNCMAELLSMHDTDSQSESDQSDHDADNNNNNFNKSSNISDSLRSCVTIDLRSHGNHFPATHKIICHDDDDGYDEIINNNGSIKKVCSSGDDDERFLSYAPTQLESRRELLVSDKEKEIVSHFHEEDDVYGDSCTVGSTSKSSSDWRSSINYRDNNSGTDQDPNFSSSSRRSCPKWESYTVFHKYDEEMKLLDRISAQKLSETESLRSIKVSPRSVSERIVRTFATSKRTQSRKQDINSVRRNPYHQLEVAYVAQICLTWEALNWNYKKFQQKRSESHPDFDPGCPARIAQQFQQFQALLQRYIENEPYEQGRRPEIYARMRLLAPKLLQIPEYRELEDEEGVGSRISSPAFLILMEDCIHTFMNFLKADKERTSKLIASFFQRKRSGSVDPTLLHLMKKVNQKKKMKLKEFRRGGKCLRRRKLKVNEGMEIVMGLIDLKVVSRVLRMKDLNEQQMRWCDEKMSKVKILDGKLKRDSLPLFFPQNNL